MDQAIFPFILTDPAGRKHECEYVFELDEDGKPTSCALWMNDHCVDAEVWDYMQVWKAYQASLKEDEGEDRAWHRRAA